MSASASDLIDNSSIAAIQASCVDYIDGQLEGNSQRVARSLHPDLAKRAVVGDTPDERLSLRRMSKEELVSLTQQGVLKTAPELRFLRSNENRGSLHQLQSSIAIPICA